MTRVAAVEVALYGEANQGPLVARMRKLEHDALGQEGNTRPLPQCGSAFRHSRTRSWARYELQQAHVHQSEAARSQISHQIPQR